MVKLDNYHDKQEKINNETKQEMNYAAVPVNQMLLGYHGPLGSNDNL